MPNFKSVIISTGSYLPENVVSNEKLSETVDTSHEWIVERTGIHQRHFAAEGQTTSDLATEAAKEALERANLKPNDIDLIVVATASSDYTFPSCATRVQDKIGNTKGLAFDVAAVCAGYLLALNVADSFLRLGKAKRALVIGAETVSNLLDMKDRTTCVLFGDGAGAVILEAVEDKDNPQDRGLIGVDLESDGRFYEILHADGGPSSTQTVGKLRMTGQEVFKHAVTKLAKSAEKTLEQYNVKPDELDWLIPHQANARIIEGMRRKLNMDESKVIVTVDKHANTSAASIPLALHDAVKSGKIKQGDLILHEAIGGGLIWGSALLRF
ncbi:MAG: ketoacyl-ACP synthase III [Alphaproteobacteria bacterium]|nr:ketoacyl-ACP synthase III [Alphaproteobacteria bacterium]NCQ67432.1 ketoacyl-ACP synthase III [Alphaproteobacteria bacterium]NCT08051.1 ketoacyl-ACP synthase III [Alphaproteobacteria bacterium]